MSYGEILSRAWSISWRHKYLWLLALFAGEAATFGLPDLQNQSTRHDNGGRPVGPGTMTYGHFMDWAGAHAALLWTIGLTAAAVLIVLFLFSAVANGALIKGVAEHDLDRPFSLGQALRSGLQTFWRVLQMKLLALVVSLAGLLLIGSVVFAAVGGAVGGHLALAVGAGVLAALLLLVLIPIAIVFAVGVLLAQRAIVLDGKRPLAALATATQLIRRRLGRVALVWLLVLAVDLLGGLLVRIAVFVVGLPLAGVVAAAYFAGGIQAAVGTGVVLGLVWLVAALALWAGLSAYMSTIWTLAYARFDQEPRPVPAARPLPA